jgi:hypothetical protein
VNLLEEVDSFDEDLLMIEFENASKDSIAWSQTTIIENTIDKIVEDSMIEICKILIMTEVVRTFSTKQIHDLIDVFVDIIRLFYWRLEENDEIANIIKNFSMLHCRHDQWIHAVIEFRLSMQFDVNMIILSRLLNDQWIHSSVIIDVLRQLIVLLEDVQLFFSDLAQMICQRLNQKSSIFNHYVLSFENITNIIIWSFHVAEDHWCVIKLMCKKNQRVITVYDSLFEHEKQWFTSHLYALLKIVIEKNTFAMWTRSSWFSFHFLQDRCISQKDDSNYDVYIMYNAFALMRREESFLKWIDFRHFRVQYAIALITACVN